MKRRNVDCGKIRRPVKRNKISESIYGSTMLYLKFLMVWVAVMFADFILEFRFEFLWPFWLLIRSVYDSFKYQGLAFSVFFICIALTSDMVCFFFIPVNWLFFAASTYVWIQYVWHTDKGICVPTIILWVLLIYLEAVVRLRDMRHMPFHLDLCRPFAAHCIGYPMVTLGFGFKSYIGYRMRQRRQRDVAKENEFYAQLLQQALPTVQNGAPCASNPVNAEHQIVVTSSTPIATTTTTTTATIGTPASSTSQAHHNYGAHVAETSNVQTKRHQSHKDAQNNGDALHLANTHTTHHNGALPNHSYNSNKTQQSTMLLTVASSSSQPRKSIDKLFGNILDTRTDVSDRKYANSNGIGHATMYMEQRCVELDVTEDKEKGGSNKDKLGTTFGAVTVTKINAKYDTSGKSSSVQKLSKKERRQLSNNNGHDNPTSTANAQVANDHDYVQQQLLKYEVDVKKLRGDVQSLRTNEHDLRAQIASGHAQEKSLRAELSQLQRENDEMQSKIQSLTAVRNSDKQALEKRINEERKLRQTAEAQLAYERRSQRRLEEQAQYNKNECTEQCKCRRREMECEMRELRQLLRQTEDKLTMADRERAAVNQQQREADLLVKAFTSIQEKNIHLEDSLSAETRIKLDLFSALGEAKRQLEIRDSMIRVQDKEIDELKSKIAQVLAVMPSDTFNVHNHHNHHVNTSVSSRVVSCGHSPPPSIASPLTSPNSQLNLINHMHHHQLSPQNSIVASTVANAIQLVAAKQLTSAVKDFDKVIGGVTSSPTSFLTQQQNKSVDVGINSIVSLPMPLVPSPPNVASNSSPLSVSIATSASVPLPPPPGLNSTAHQINGMATQNGSSSPNGSNCSTLDPNATAYTPKTNVGEA